MMRLIAILFCLLPLLSTAQFPLSGAGRDVTEPDQVDSLFYWFDATDATTITTNNNKVTLWDDKSGNGYDVVQSDTSKAPTYSATSGPGGSTGGMTFDGTDDYLASAAHWWGSDDFTIFLVMKHANATLDANETIIARYETTSPSDGRQFVLLSRPASESYTIEYLWSDDGTATDEARFSAKSADFRVIALTTESSNATTTAHIDGASQLVIDDNPGVTHTSMHDVSVPLSIGAVNPSSTPVLFLNGSMSEIIMYSRSLTSDERGQIEAYLSNKYNLTLENDYRPRADIYRIPPNYIDSLEYHFDASTGVLDSLGGSIATDEGVGTWTDQSGNGSNAVQATNGARPVYKANGGPGTPCIQFDGSNDFLATAGELWNGEDITLFAVYNHLAAGTNQVETIAAKYETSTDERQWTFFGADNSTSPQYRLQFNWSGTGTSTVRTIHSKAIKTTAFNVFSMTKGTNETGMYWWEDGEKLYTVTGGSAGTQISNFTQPLSIGAVNPTGTPSSFLGGCICELVIYSRVLNKRERQGVENWLLNKYGL